MACSGMKAHRLSMDHVSYSGALITRIELIAMEDTLDSYIEKYSSLVGYLADHTVGRPPSDPAPPYLGDVAISLQVWSPCSNMTRAETLSSQTPVFQDSPPKGMKFGDVLVDVRNTSYQHGETVFVQFVGFVLLIV